MMARDNGYPFGCKKTHSAAKGVPVLQKVFVSTNSQQVFLEYNQLRSFLSPKS
jgi:hypothetical protein